MNAAAPNPAADVAAPPAAPRANALTRGVPRWLALSLMGLYLLVVAGVVWGIAQGASGCAAFDVLPPEGILPGPQPCGPDATTPALATVSIIAVLLAGAFVVAFTLVRRRGTVLLSIAGAMLLVGVIGAIATLVAASSVPPVIYY